MDFFDYKDIYAKNFLNEIKTKIRENQMKLSGDKEKETDKKMVQVIKGQSDNLLRGMTINSSEETERIMCTLMLYYTALYNDNLDVLNKLLEHGYSFGTNRNNLNLFALDKRITSRFNLEQYCELLDKQSIIFENFYNSLTEQKIETELTEDEIINIFCRILNKNSEVAYIEKGIRYYYYSYPLHEKLLTKKSIIYFDEDVIVNATEKQKKNIIVELNRSSITLTKESLSRLNFLMTNHNFSTDMDYSWDQGLKELTDEELIKINGFEENLFNKHYVSSSFGANLHAIRAEINKEETTSNSKEDNPKKRGLNIFKRRR